MNDFQARKFIELLEDAGYSITKKRKLGKFEFKIYYDGSVSDYIGGFTTPAGAWAYVRTDLGAGLHDLWQLKQMGYAVRRVKKLGH